MFEKIGRQNQDNRNNQDNHELKKIMSYSHSYDDDGNDGEHEYSGKHGLEYGAENSLEYNAEYNEEQNEILDDSESHWSYLEPKSPYEDEENTLNGEGGQARGFGLSKFDISRTWIRHKKLILLGAAIFVAFIIIGSLIVRSNDSEQVPSFQPVPISSAGSFLTTTTTIQKKIVIHIVGAVKSPNVYELPLGSRVNDAINLAGGATENAFPNLLNLAAVISDGEKICVPASLSESNGCEAHIHSISKADSRPLNINTANARELDTLPKIGPTLAEKIISYRQTDGPFDSVDDLENISGITSTIIDGFRDSITVQ